MKGMKGMKGMKAPLGLGGPVGKAEPGFRTATGEGHPEAVIRLEESRGIRDFPPSSRNGTVPHGKTRSGGTEGTEDTLPLDPLHPLHPCPIHP